MNVNITCATTDGSANWKSIDWNKCELQVKKLQERIVKARKEGKHGKVKSLQWILTHSFAAKDNILEFHIIGGLIFTEEI